MTEITKVHELEAANAKLRADVDGYKEALKRVCNQEIEALEAAGYSLPDVCDDESLHDYLTKSIKVSQKWPTTAHVVNSLTAELRQIQNKQNELITQLKNRVRHLKDPKNKATTALAEAAALEWVLSELQKLIAKKAGHE